MAKAKEKMLMVTLLSKLMAKAKSEILMVIPLLQTDGEGEVEDADGNPSAPNWS